LIIFSYLHYWIGSIWLSTVESYSSDQCLSISIGLCFYTQSECKSLESDLNIHLLINSLCLLQSLLDWNTYSTTVWLGYDLVHLHSQSIHWIHYKHIEYWIIGIDSFSKSSLSLWNWFGIDFWSEVLKPKWTTDST